ncbi:MAG: hypothetical protein NTV01_05715, partial [Bacteroidia bacterium]|nr:hypothetical protein [Bacteroidia bacterium]
MSIQDIAAKYSISEEDVAVVNSLIESERNKGIEASRKKSKEVLDKMTALNKLRDTLKELGMNPDDDLEVQTASFKEKLSKSGTSSDNSEIEKVMREVSGLKKRLEEKEKIEVELSGKLRNKTITEILSQAMGDNFHAKDLTIKDFIREGKVKLTDDNNVVFLDGNEEIELPKGIDAFKKARPDLVKNIQSGGSGSGRVIIDGKGKKTLSE